MQTSYPIAEGDFDLDQLEFDDIEGFVLDKQLNLFDALPTLGLNPIMRDELGAVFSFNKEKRPLNGRAPQNADDFWAIVRHRYNIIDEKIGDEITELVDSLQVAGLKIDEEYDWLLVAIDEIIREGTITLSDEAAARLDQVEAKITAAAQPAEQDSTWAQAGLVALVGVALSTAITTLKKNKAKKVDENERDTVSVAENKVAA